MKQRLAYGSQTWCKRVAENKSLTTADHDRIAIRLGQSGNLKALLTIQKLLTEEL